MPKYAVVQQSDGLVVNIIVADEGDSPPVGCSFIPAEYCSPGWIWDGQQFYDPNPPLVIEESPSEEIPLEGEEDGV